MNSDIGLIIIFNHKFVKNLDKLRDLYKNRFSNILFLMPFYSGNDKDVVCVYESSFQFQGYITQAEERISEMKCKQYVFIGDDLILNPKINEDNIIKEMGINENDSYIESIRPLKLMTEWGCYRFREANNVFLSTAVNYRDEIPGVDEATKKAKEYGIYDYRLKKYPTKLNSRQSKILQINSILYNSLFNKIDIKYPLVAGYSDFFILTKNKLHEFCRLSGVFAAMNLFVEISIPTTLMLICEKDNLKMQKDINMRTEEMWLLTNVVSEFEKSCDNKVENMNRYWPKDYLYLHPLKLSKWN